MAAKLTILLAALVLAHGALVKREATALEDIQKNAAQVQKLFSEQWNSLVNSKNTEAVNKALKDGTDSVLQQLTTLSASVQTALADANGKAKEAFEQTKVSLDRVTEDLRKQHPEIEQQASEVGTKLQSAVQTTLTETQKLSKQIADNVDQTNEKLKPQFDEAYKSLVKHLEELHKNIAEAAAKKQ